MIGAEAANDAVEGGALASTVAFGIPGSSSMAILLGGLFILGLETGVDMVTTDVDIVFVMIFTVIFGNLIGTIFGMFLVNPLHERPRFALNNGADSDSRCCNRSVRRTRVTCLICCHADIWGYRLFDENLELFAGGDVDWVCSWSCSGKEFIFGNTVEGHIIFPFTDTMTLCLITLGLLPIMFMG